MDIDTDTTTTTDTSSIYSTPPTTFSQPFSTPPSQTQTQTPWTTPQSSGSTFSQTFGASPCPANNAYAPLPVFSEQMEGVVYAVPRAPPPTAARAPPRANGVISFATVQQPASAPQQQPAQAAIVSHAPARNVVAPFAMQTSSPQIPAALQASRHATGTKNGVVPFAIQSATPQLPAAPQASSAQPSQPRSSVVPFTMQPSTLQPAAALQASPAPPKNGVVSFTMQSSTTQAPAASQPSAQPSQPAPQQTSSQPFQPALQPALQPAPAQPSQPVPQQVSAQPSQPALQPATAQAAQPQDTAGATPTVSVVKEVVAPLDIWVGKDPAQVFKAPSLLSSVAVAPRWATIQTLPQLAPGGQIWDIQQPATTAAPQPSSSDIPAQPLTAAPVPSGTAGADQISIDDALETVLGQLASLHISEPATWSWTEPSMFGRYIGKDKGSNFDLQLLAAAANTQLPREDSDDTLSILPATGCNGSPSAVPETTVQDRPVQDVAPPPSFMAPQPTVCTAPLTVSAPPPAVIPAGAPTNNGSPDEAMQTEGSQPADKGKGKAVAGQEQIDRKDIKAALAAAHQLMALLQDTRPIASGPGSPSTAAPTFGQPSGSQSASSSAAPTALGGAVSQGSPAYEVGGDDDPNVDSDFDWGKHLSRRSAPAAAAVASLSPESGASASSPSSSAGTFTDASSLTEASPPPEASPPKVSPPAAASTTAEAIPPAEASSSSDATLPDAPSLVGVIIAPAVPFPPVQTPSTAAPLAAQASPPVEARFPATWPLPDLPPDDDPPCASILSARAYVPRPRATNKRYRDIESYRDRDIPPPKVSLGYYPGPIMESEVWKDDFRGVVAALNDRPPVFYSEEYAMQMMRVMFYNTLPRVASEVMFPIETFSARDQMEEADDFVTSMVGAQLNEKSFEMVQDEYGPQFGFSFPLRRRTIFNFFADWFVDLIAYEIPSLTSPAMDDDELNALEGVLLPEFDSYLDTHPPEDRD